MKQTALVRKTPLRATQRPLGRMETFSPDGHSKPKAKARQRLCKVCRTPFDPLTKDHVVCSSPCVLEWAARHIAKRAEAKRKAERKALITAKEDVQPIRYWIKRAQNAVNALRRAECLNDGMGCITCGTHDAEEWHAGHFVPVGRSSSIRFDSVNIWLQCRQCNFFGGGMPTTYEARLNVLVGHDEVQRLKNAPRLYIWTREELQTIETVAKAALASLKKVLHSS